MGDIRKELLLDVQTPSPTFSAAERRMIDILTKVVVGGTVVWYSIVELTREVSKNRSNT